MRVYTESEYNKLMITSSYTGRPFLPYAEYIERVKWYMEQPKQEKQKKEKKRKAAVKRKREAEAG